jgi:hypothetical protein
MSRMGGSSIWMRTCCVPLPLLISMVMVRRTWCWLSATSMTSELTKQLLQPHSF